MKNRLSLALLLIGLCYPVLLVAKVSSHGADYVGGTVPSIAAPLKGRISMTDDKVFAFDYKGGRLAIPYDSIDSLEYGQKAGRRIGLAIAVTPIALLSKKRKHFLTIGYQDENGKQQAAVFEIGKDTVRVDLATIEARTGRKVEYQDEEARKSGAGN
ncbi:MAG TPA: hypothetical protein VGZ29_16460 [Terriglobia bacterium]|nr:hypothetical protein [Terriglobia bacterium]